MPSSKPLLRAVSLDASETDVHREETLDQEAAAGHPDLVEQAGAGGDPPHSGGVLRTPVFRSLPWFSSWTWVPYRSQRGAPHVEWDQVVHRRGPQPIFRQP